MKRALSLMTVCLAGSFASCGDPVRDDAVAALGPESPFVQPGPMHRVGQPCLLCHTEGGGAATFTLGGTVYLDATSGKPIAGVEVFVFDANNQVFKTYSNCAGNFYATPAQFTPQYPIWVTLRGGNVQRDMDSAAYREGSCAGCHTGTRTSSSSPGPVFLIANPTTEIPPPDVCH